MSAAAGGGTDRRGPAPRSSAQLALLGLLGLIAAACVVAGTLARFRGLGRWPLAIDEYYTAQSVQNILRVGLPEYPCGGYYLRGLLLQYGAAALQLAGLGPELAPRLIAGLSSLLALPAAYLLGRRLAGASTGIALVAILAFSVWEVEVARFGRMYAPFQAIFLWYLVCFLALTLDRRKGALAWMLALSVAGALVWEGGALLGFMNLLPPLMASPGRLRRRDWLGFVTLALFAMVLLHIAGADLLSAGGEPDLPPDYQPLPGVHLSRLDAAVMPLATLGRHAAWMLAALAPLSVALLAAARLLGRIEIGARPLTAAALVAVLACGLLQQFALAASFLLLMLLLEMLHPRDLLSREALPLHASLFASAAFWIAFGLTTADWHAAGLSLPHRVLLLGYELVRFPNLFRVVIVPWARTVPVLGLSLLLLIGVSMVRVLSVPPPPAARSASAERALLVIFVASILAASAGDLPRYETRYLFFLYPLALLFALVTIDRAVRALVPAASARAPVGAPAAALLALGAFALTEDFAPRHLRNIDTAAINFRIGMSAALVQHYHPRSEVRGAARWLADHVDRSHDTVVNAYPGVDFYYPASDYFFMDESDPRFENWSCRRGTIDRWSNRPLLYTTAALAARMSGGRRIWLVLERSLLESVLSRLPPLKSSIAWTSQAKDIVILSLQRTEPLPLKTAQTRR